MKSKYFLTLLLAAGLFIAACKQQPPDWSNVITFSTAGPQSVVADGYDTLKLTAHINPNSDPDKRMITFSTDYGTFTNGMNTIEINADINGNASTGLKGSAVGTATVRATVQTTYSVLKTVYFVAPAASQIFTVGPYNTSPTADGVTPVAITATFNQALLATTQNMSFTTDGGSFLNSTTPTITVPANTAGVVTAYLKSNVAGPVHVTLTSDNVSQVLTLNFVAGTAATIFTVNPITGTAFADGVTTLPIGVVVNKNLLVTTQNVVFTTDGGTFGNGTATITQAADANGNAVVYLKNTVAETAHINITNSNLTQTTSATFITALPDVILLSAAPTLDTGYDHSLTVSIALKRSVGTVSPNLLLSYVATDASGNTVGAFSSAATASDQNGNAMVIFTMGNSGYSGNITIKVWLQTNPAINASVNVLVNPSGG